ncbi:hypothetical protein DRF65_17890 [Chryseobacterium pennae]|uniref:Uncharacterized protein n=2 Tax=Chryseobacterium pennae TaxID=2258962 RepID=A0A3D9C4V3_9FLAO|nr:hypothetical protein DRF65_17890 [Chryseobacterium pennae]
MIPTNLILKNKIIIIFLLIVSSCKSTDNNISNIVTDEAEKMIENSSKIKSEDDVLCLYSTVRNNDSIVGIAYGMPTFEKNKYYLKKVSNTPLLIEKNIYLKYFKIENLNICNETKYFRGENYFPNIGEPYFVNIFIKNGKVQKVERQNIPEK